MMKNQRIRSFISESWSVSWPMTLIMFFVFLVGFSDVYVAGKFGDKVQAAYGVSFQIYFIFGIVASALSVGIVSVVSRLFTSHKKDDFLAAVDSSLLITAATGILLSIAGFFSAGQITASLHVPDTIKPVTVSLARIYLAGLIFNYLLLNTNALLRACNMIRRSLFSMAVVCTLNIILNFILAFHTSLGFTGIAWATLLSMLMGTLLNIFFVRRLILLTCLPAGREILQAHVLRQVEGLNLGMKGIVHFLLMRKPRTLVRGVSLSTSGSYSYTIVREIIRISWPAGLLQVFWQLGFMVLFLILGSLPVRNIETMAAFTNGLKIEAVIFLPAFAFNMANAVIVGNLIGRKLNDDAFYGGLVTAFIGTIIVTIMTIIIMFGAGAIAAFLSNNVVVRQECLRYIYIQLAFEPIMAWGVILAGGLNGAGDTKSVMLIIALSIWLVRVPLSYVFGLHFAFGAVAIWWAMNCSIVAQSVFITGHYFRKSWLK